MRLMLFCVGNVVDDDVTVDRIFLVNPVCSLRSAVCGLPSANVIHRYRALDRKLHQATNSRPVT